MVGSIDPRCETVRGTHWPVKVAGVFGTRVAENHLGQRSKRPASTGRTYGCKRSDQTLKKTLAARGPSTYGSRRALAPLAWPGRRLSTSKPLNPPPCAFPIGIAQAPLENLAGILARQLGLDFDVFWHLVVGERGFQLRADVSDIQRHACLRFHHRHQRFAEFLVGNAEHRAVVDTGDRVQGGLDFGGIDVDPARDHHVALAITDEDIAVLVDIADIAGGDEAVAFDLGAFLRL